MGEEYHRMTPLPNFLLKTHGSHRGDRQNAPTLSVRPVKAHFVPWQCIYLTGGQTGLKSPLSGSHAIGLHKG